ncbi:M20/M25/M40 family metallo-hydrolase [uncultured Gimesia sp.]|uniref:M20/M25/M40 family metallo-hydrolase n=1 Tax=uncultured Gimesia sp. TaxID=1678688 RepID=UPI0030DAAE79|tara:strand:+ start:61134 stop:62339 length:1206 start_codon:yes stop_codon:yes gene_type:complete
MSPRTTAASAKVNSKQALQLVTALMAIPGKSGEEGNIAAEIVGRLRKAGLPEKQITFDAAYKKSPIGGETGNLIVKLPGTIRGPRRLLMAHMDTVPLCVGAEPVRKGNLIHSKSNQTALGADDRGGCSVILNALLTILEQDLPHPPLTFCWMVQEEIGLVGVRNLATGKLGKPKLCFNWDGKLADMICIGATGDSGMLIHISGIASHAGAHPELGVSAAVIAGKAIEDLVENGWHGLVLKGKESGSSNIGVLSGGAATNVVMPELTIKAEARSHNPRFRQKILNEFKKAFQKSAKTTKNSLGKRGSISFESHLKYDSFRLSEEEPAVQTAKQAIQKLGGQPKLTIGNGGLDANWMAAHGFPTVTLGCGQQDIHTTNETLMIDEYLKACEIGLLAATATETE